MLEIETGQASIKKLNEELAQVQDRLKDEHKKLYSEQESLTHDLSDLQAERKAAISTIDSGFLNTYEKIRQQRRGVAVAEVLENACRACGTTLTAALQQSARHASQLVYCPSCGRILYAG
jgi:predicted  nucleic acid-binding Zn-ribbon protein